MKKNIWLFALVTLLAISFATGGAAFAVPVNVANLYGTATANGHYSFHTPDLAIDNDKTLESYWNIPDFGTVSDPNWLIVDLGASFSVNTIDLFWMPYRTGTWDGYTNVYNAYYGNDTTNWVQFGQGTFVDGGTLQQREHVYTFGGAGQDMRYVKYEVVGGTHWSTINEISVWADDGPVPVPEPSTMLLFGTGLIAFLGRRKKVNR